MATQANLEHGRFSDSARVFIVRASSREAPDSFQVAANDNPADLVLVVSGLNSGDLRATWGENWRTASEAWKRWLEDQAFMTFYSGKRPTIIRTPIETRTLLASPTTPGSSNTRRDRQPALTEVTSAVTPSGHRCNRGDFNSDTPDRRGRAATGKVRFCNG